MHDLGGMSDVGPDTALSIDLSFWGSLSVLFPKPPSGLFSLDHQFHPPSPSGRSRTRRLLAPPRRISATSSIRIMGPVRPRGLPPLREGPPRLGPRLQAGGPPVPPRQVGVAVPLPAWGPETTSSRCLRHLRVLQAVGQHLGMYTRAV